MLTGRPALFPSVVWWALQLVALAGGALLAAVAATLGRPSLSAGRLCYPRVLLVLFSMLHGHFSLLLRGPDQRHRLRPLPMAPGLQPRRPAPGPTPGAIPHGRTPGAHGAHARGRGRTPGSPERHPGPGRRPAPAGQLLATAALSTVVAAVATVITLNADAYDAARWSAGNKAVAAGVPATMVDAGFEWVGSHQSARRRPGTPGAGEPVLRDLVRPDVPGLQSNAPLSPATRSRSRRSDGWPRSRTKNSGSQDAQDLYVYLVRRPGC